VSYLVPAGSYLSTVSEADADNKAQADVTAKLKQLYPGTALILFPA
jgi:hypothetical protein